jgi:macrophage erythroblast attacher
MSAEEIPLILNDVLQVPLHQINKQFRASQKAQEQGANVALKALKDLLQRVSAKEDAGESVSPDKIIAALDKITTKLQEIKDQVQSSSLDLQTGLESLTFRIAMRNGTSPLQQETHDSKRARSSLENPASTERMLELAVISNHLLRTSRFRTFKTLCNESDCTFLLQDAEIFQTHSDVCKGLCNKHEAEPALQWCTENRSSLKKLNSTFEFDLRLRQFCELVEAGDIKEAVLFSRKYLAQNAHDETMRKAMAMLAFPKGTLENTPYKQFVSGDNWAELGEKFLKERGEVMNLNFVSPLEILVRVGLAVTRTQTCKPDGPGRAAGCPACQPSLGKLAISIPRTLRERSSLVCRISGAVMEDPLVLPNGQAYSRSALEQMAFSRGDGKVCCPVTHQEFYLKDAKRAFVL